MGEEQPTEIEVRMVQTAPLAFELEAAGDAMVKAIKKLPPEGQPAGLAAALALVAEMATTADAAVGLLPDYPLSLSPLRISTEGEELEEFYKDLPPDSPAQIFLPGLGLLSNVDEMVSPVSSDSPVLPHQLTTTLINNQSEMLIEYITNKFLTS